MGNIVFCPWIILNVNGPMHKSNNDNSWFHFKNVDVETILPMCKITFCDCRFFKYKTLEPNQGGILHTVCTVDGNYRYMYFWF